MDDGHIFIKNSSNSVNFGDYTLRAKIYSDGGRVFQDKEYKCKIYCDEKKNTITLIVAENESQFILYECQHPN